MPGVAPSVLIKSVSSVKSGVWWNSAIMRATREPGPLNVFLCWELFWGLVGVPFFESFLQKKNPRVCETEGGQMQQFLRCQTSSWEQPRLSYGVSWEERGVGGGGCTGRAPVRPLVGHRSGIFIGRAPVGHRPLAPCAGNPLQIFHTWETKDWELIEGSGST